MAFTSDIFGRGSNIFDPFFLDVRDPFHGFPSDTSRSSLYTKNNYYNDNNGSSSSSGIVTGTSALDKTRVDWKETPEAHVFKADLPGLKKEEVKVEVEEGRVLKISGERTREKEEKGDNWHWVERSRGKFCRRFRLPEDAKIDQIKASMENGVLTLNVPKEEEEKKKKPEVKSIEISG